MDAKIVIGSVALKEKPLFGSLKTWVFDSLAEAIEALEPGGSVERRRLTQLECVVEKSLVVQGRTPGLDQSERIEAKTNAELLGCLQQTACNLAYLELSRLWQEAHRQDKLESRETLEYAIAVGESAFSPTCTLSAVRTQGCDWPDLIKMLAFCYSDLIALLEASDEPNVAPQEAEPPLPPLGDPNRKTERRRTFAQRGYQLPRSKTSMSSVIEKYRKRHGQLLEFAERSKR